MRDLILSLSLSLSIVLFLVFVRDDMLALT